MYARVCAHKFWGCVEQDVLACICPDLCCSLTLEEAPDGKHILLATYQATPESGSVSQKFGRAADCLKWFSKKQAHSSKDSNPASWPQKAMCMCVRRRHSKLSPRWSGCSSFQVDVRVVIRSMYVCMYVCIYIYIYQCIYIYIIEILRI